VLYLIGIKDFGIDRTVMRQASAEFFFMAALTGRYTNSTETRFEADLALLRDVADGDAFLGKLREICSTTLTDDFWKITLPEGLATSAARSPSLFAYNASLVKLDADALYSRIKIASLVDPAVRGPKAALERHHLFPRGYLEAQGIRDVRKINQIANFAPVEWPENIRIGKQSPAEYVPPLDAALSGPERNDQYFWHALPPLWWELDYDTFLMRRRERMAQMIHRAWQMLRGTRDETRVLPVDLAELIRGGETASVEFKSTLRVNLHTGQSDDRIQVSALKTIVGFLNSASGGRLLIGVTDDGDVLGVDADGFPDEDKMGQHLENLIRDRIGPVFQPYIHPGFDDQGEGRVLSILCDPGPRPAFLKDGALQRFFVRGGNTTTELQGPDITEYVRQRFR